MSPIIYTEKGAKMHEALARAGLHLGQFNNVWMTNSDPIAVQAFITAYDALPDVKAERIALFKADGLARVQAIYPAIADCDQLDLFSDLWGAIKGTSKNTMPALEKAIATRAAIVSAIAAVNAALTIPQVKLVTVNWPP